MAQAAFTVLDLHIFRPGLGGTGHCTGFRYLTWLSLQSSGLGWEVQVPDWASSLQGWVWWYRSGHCTQFRYLSSLSLQSSGLGWEVQVTVLGLCILPDWASSLQGWVGRYRSLYWVYVSYLTEPPVFRAGLGGMGMVTVLGLDSLLTWVGRVKVMIGLDEIRCPASSLYLDFTSLTVPRSTGWICQCKCN